MKKTIAALSALLLAGCVTYYPYPYAVEATVSSTGETVVYAEEPDDYAYYDSSAGSSVYYPWTSVDYFYFGNHYYRPAVTFSLSYGIYGGGPWYGPYYGPYYYPGYWYAWYGPYSYYGYPYFGPAYAWGAWNYWYAPNWRHNYYGHGYGHGHGNGHGYGRGDGYGHRDGYGGGHSGGHPGNYGRGNRGNGYGDEGGESGYAGDPRERTNQGRQRPNDGTGGRGSLDDPSREIGSVNRNRAVQQQELDTRGGSRQVRRQVGVAPGQNGSDRGIDVVSRDDGKLKPNRTGPVQPQPVTGSVAPRNPNGGSQTNANQQVRVQPQRPVPMPEQGSGRAQPDRVVAQNRQPVQVSRPVNAPQTGPQRPQSDYQRPDRSDNGSSRSFNRPEPRDRGGSDDDGNDMRRRPDRDQ